MPCFNAGIEPELPRDQREDDSNTLTFDTAPLDSEGETVGTPLLDLHFFVDRPAAFLAIRLCDVKPDRGSARVNLRLHDLTHTREVIPSPPRLEPSLARHEVEAPARVGSATHELAADETSEHIADSSDSYRLDDIDWTVGSRLRYRAVNFRMPMGQ